ncbi:MAG: phosphoenolpyruvate--protein phosphotransferase [Mycobacterium sp.]|nr:phosphoenolpyruvate--protein phosphotransferase [Mycobacterium sp.]
MPGMMSPRTHGPLSGVPVVPGVRYAPVIRPEAAPPPVPAASTPADPDAEATRFEAAVGVVAERLRGRAARATGPAAELLAVTAALATDKAWLAAARTRIAGGAPAERATAEAIAGFAEIFAGLGGLMAERVTDLNDIRDRVTAELVGWPEPGVTPPDSPSILCVDDLSPADAALLDPALVVGLATTLGGPTSHTAIIARQLGIPCVVAVAGLGGVAAGTMVLIDGTRGTVLIEPDPAAAAAEIARAESAAAALAYWSGPGVTADDHRVELLANVADGAAARAATATPAEGVGLLRTELCFLHAEAEPTVEEQAGAYAEVLRAFPGGKVVIRTFDAGSDKPLAFVGATGSDEANPALGVRGYRVSAADRGLLERQLTAIARAAEQSGAAPWVMAPMIATPAEAAEFAEQARAHGLSPGVMIEVPAAALLADRILAHVDFLSVGTNDLAQYTMAADRLSAELAALTDPWQPAVLALVAMVARAGRDAGKPVGACGEAAADPLLACVLTGMELTSLSSAPAAVRAVGARLATVSLAQCRDAAEAALASSSAADARAAAAAVLEQGIRE